MSTAKSLQLVLADYVETHERSLLDFSKWCITRSGDGDVDHLLAVWHALSSLCIFLKAESPGLDAGIRNMIDQLYELQIEIGPEVKNLETAIKDDEKQKFNRLVRTSLGRLANSLGEFGIKCGDYRGFEAWLGATLAIRKTDPGSAMTNPSTLPATRQWDAFICHSSEDKDSVRELVKRLKKKGVTVWFDEDQIRLGDPITERIEEGLRSTQWVIVCISPNLGRSNWCRREYGPVIHQEIVKNDIRVIPVEVAQVADEDIPELLYDKLRVTDCSAPDQFAALVNRLQSTR